MDNFDLREYLAEGRLLKENFGNDIESRFQYVRPLMARLPDSDRTEAMLDGMEEARDEDDKMAFDFYFVETMKMLGKENELMEAEDFETALPRRRGRHVWGRWKVKYRTKKSSMKMDLKHYQFTFW